MTKTELQDVLKSMVIVVDTREHQTEGYISRVIDTGLPYTRRKLDFGDYSCQVTFHTGIVVSFENCVVIERKMSLAELAQNFTGNRRKRFEAEFQRAKEAGAKMYLLIENGSLDMVIKHSYRSQMNPTAFIASIFAFLARYKCQILFCKPQTTGRIIREIMTREVTERLTANERKVCGDNKERSNSSENA
ncbi:ERCC4 domain-containing protein [Candidatus Saccharibacteria bacterium]|nr:ERCC4 domain-containing protein [Candidatus Saccharibacteria bacterium]